MSATIIRRIGLLFLLAIVSINSLFILLDYPGYIKFLERTISPDGKIECPDSIIVLINYALFLMAIVIIKAKSLGESVARSSRLNQSGYWVAGMLIIAYIFLRPRLPEFFYIEDSFFETLTVLAALLSAIILSASIRHQDGFAAIATKLILALLFFFFGMEETSWGQRLFGWETPAAFAELNYQSETNIHNLYNPYFDLLYFIFNLSLCFFLFNSERIGMKVRTLPGMDRLATLIPSREFKFYGLILLGLAGYSMFEGGELTEEVFAFFGLAYALNQFFIAKAARP